MLLVIDTATAACSVALVDRHGRIVAEAHEIVGRGHAERLMPMIAALPAGGRAREILVDVGPGSFTGVRVGLAAARGLGIGWDAGVSGFSSLAAIAWHALAGSDAACIAAAVPGGHGEVFVQIYAAAPFRAETALVSLPFAAAAKATGGVALAGPGAALLVAAAATGPVLSDTGPSATVGAQLPAAFRALLPTPLYGRAPDAKLPA